MDRRRSISRWLRQLLASGVGVVMVLAGSLTASSQARPQPVTGWIRHHAIPLDTVDPAAPLGDLMPLRPAIGDAEIVGLGESTHGAAEEETLKLRILRLLVERMGFRSVAWEEDRTTGLLIDEYIRTGRGNLDTLMAQMSPKWQSLQVADVLAWLRDYNAATPTRSGSSASSTTCCGPWPMTPSTPTWPGPLRSGLRSCAATFGSSAPPRGHVRPHPGARSASRCREARAVAAISGPSRARLTQPTS
jgi:Erythromycin esterase